MYSKTTKKINITVKPYYLEDQSEPDDQHYVWAYRVTINNQGKDVVQLKNRFWKITDSNGTKQEVSGEGVVGEQPILKDGWGNISFSHCRDAITIAWSSEKIGIDLERSDRKFDYEKLCQKYFSKKEKINYEKLKYIDKRLYVLDESNPNSFVGKKNNSFQKFLKLSKINIQNLINGNNKFYEYNDFKEMETK